VCIWNAINISFGAAVAAKQDASYELLLVKGTIRQKKKPPHTSKLTQKLLQWSYIVWIECFVGAQLRTTFLPEEVLLCGPCLRSV